jgi:histone-lysine N-methyltransferase SETMAR
MEREKTVNTERYSAMLKDKLKPAIRGKRKGLLSKIVLLHHDNARPHATTATIETIQKLNFELLPHQSYSPDLAQSDCHLFGELKKRHCGDVVSEVMKSNKRCTLGFATNQKHFSLVKLRSLLKVVKSVWIGRETMLKNYVIIMPVSASNKK